MIKLFKRLKWKEWIQVIASLIFIVVQVWLDLKLPDYMAQITNMIQTPGSVMSDIWLAGGRMMVCALGSLISAVAVGFFAARIAAAFSQRLRSLLFSKVIDFSMEEINRFSTDSLITRSTNDITQVQLLITMGLQLIIKAPIMVVWAMTKIVGKGVLWSLATGVTLGIMFVLLGIIIIFVMPKFKKMQTLTDNLNRVARENLTGLRVVRAYNAEGYQENKFEQANEELTAAQLYTNRGMAVMMPVVQVIMQFLMLVMIFTMMPRAIVSAKRINEVLDTKPAIVDGHAKDGVQESPHWSIC